MSRHLCPARGPRGGAKYVVAGFDRPLQEFFLQVYQGPAPAMDKVAHAQTFVCAEDLSQALSVLRITTPAGLIDEVRRDGERNVGNRIVQHSFDAPAKELHPG